MDLASLRGRNFLFIAELTLNDRITAMLDEKKKSGRVELEAKAKQADEYYQKYINELKAHKDSADKFKIQLEDEKKSHALAVEELEKNHAKVVCSLKQGFVDDRDIAMLELTARMEKEKEDVVAAKDTVWKTQIPLIVKKQVDRILAKKSGKADSGATQQH
ncbi:hypothetical protein AQUCO_06100055v1 [Aquilegia coerulea]|uniref:ZMYND8 coiled-coil domain-containing protein n=1 Tax=Aquilegia coerulea TaxID=218851 RepID=A0A2G5CDC0_AQUCA|nr:hypothetical protein AQUCO_06100055v1 [Aquilegia coerulea]